MRSSILFMLSLVFLSIAGCRVVAPIHVWTPPELESVVGKKVGISDVEGTAAIAGPIRKKMLSMSPNDAGRALIAIDTQHLNALQPIQLVSAISDEINSGHIGPTGQISTLGSLNSDAAPPAKLKPPTGTTRTELPSDVATAALARSAGLDYILRGEVIQHSQEKPQDATLPFDPDKPVRVSWRLLSVKDNRPVGGKPVVIDGKTAAMRYPDLALSSNPSDALLTALVRESYRLVSPSIRETHIKLAIPYGLPGSREVRAANDLAVAGKWGEAEPIWQDVADRHPTQAAAFHNLALAAVAGQDFSRAKALARKAVRRNPAPLHKNTLVWIEQKQRDYHLAFNLPDPPEGWFVSRTQE